MKRNNSIKVVLFDTEIGRLGYDAQQRASFFQYHPDFLESGNYSNIFPYIFKRVNYAQIFTLFEGETFRGLPPMIADSLPDSFGNLIFKQWMEAQKKELLTPVEQLTYVANRGMGALEYQPTNQLPKAEQLVLDEIVQLLQQVLQQKGEIHSNGLSEASLLNIFKIGTSAGGARPKIIVSEHKETHQLIPGDIEVSDHYNHYLIKLNMPDDEYNASLIEMAYYSLATSIGIEMMPSKLIDNKHFATLRFDRQNGTKQHVLTATGLTGWDFKKPDVSSYENLFKLAISLKVTHKELQQLFVRMVFNVIFKNTDDHLKNHSFIYQPQSDSWQLAPAYDITYGYNPLYKLVKTSRALSINGKRVDISRTDILTIAEEHAIKSPNAIIDAINELTNQWYEKATLYNIPEKIISEIQKEFNVL